jgi:hypothetical protein
MLGFFSFIRGQFLQGLISLIELPEDTNVPDDEHFIEIKKNKFCPSTLFFSRMVVKTYVFFFLVKQVIFLPH